MKINFKEYFNLINIAAISIVLPIIVFLIGFIKIYIALPVSLVFLFTLFKFVKENKNSTGYSFDKKSIVYIIISLIVVFLWVIMSGIGGFSYQNDGSLEYIYTSRFEKENYVAYDWDVRNAVFKDLVNESWPLKVHLKDQAIMDFIKIGPDYAFSYYYTYWLIPAIVGKLFGMGVGNIFLFLYSVLLVYLAISLLNKKVKGNVVTTAAIFILFSGMDILLFRKQFPDIIFRFNHIEKGITYLQYSSNTTLLYWVFNQSIMTWLIMSVLINLKEPKQVLFISALTFAYSPFATIGLVPIVIAIMIKNFIDGEEVKKVSKEVVIKFAKQFISFETLCAIFLLIIYGTYYTASDTAIADRGWTWEIAKMSFSEFIKLYIEFIACEVLFYFILLIRRNKKDPIFWVVILELIIFPFYVMTYSNDLMMRGSIPALFILCYFVIKYLSESDKVKVIIPMLIILIIGSVTPLHEISRSVFATTVLHRKDLLNPYIESVVCPKTMEGTEICYEQFYVKDYNNKFFFKYLSKDFK